MSLSIGTNTGALMAAASATYVNKDMETSMERLSTGKRINSAADDAAGVAIASRLTSEIRGTNQAIRNAQDGQALIDTAEGAHKEVENILQRMREVAVQSANDTNDSSDRANLQGEMDQLTNEINRISTATTWAGQSLLDGSGGTDSDGKFSLQMGANTGASDVLTVDINAIDAGTLGVTGPTDKADAPDFFTGVDTFDYSSDEATDIITVTSAQTTVANPSQESSVEILGVTITAATPYNITATTDDATRKLSAENLANAINSNEELSAQGIVATVGTVTTAGSETTNQVTISQESNNVSSNAAAQNAIKHIDGAISTLNAQRADLGAVSNRLDNTVSNLTNISIQLEGGKGRIEDADFAAESTSLAKSQILQQASTAMLAQANASKESVLSLLQG